MKKTVYYLLFCFTVLFAFHSCGEDDSLHLKQNQGNQWNQKQITFDEFLKSEGNKPEIEKIRKYFQGSGFSNKGEGNVNWEIDTTFINQIVTPEMTTYTFGVVEYDTIEGFRNVLVKVSEGVTTAMLVHYPEGVDFDNHTPRNATGEELGAEIWNKSMWCFKVVMITVSCGDEECEYGWDLVEIPCPTGSGSEGGGGTGSGGSGNPTGPIEGGFPPGDGNGGPGGGGGGGYSDFDYFLMDLTNQQKTWLMSNPNIMNQIYTYLENNNYNNSAYQFALWAIEYLMENPGLSTVGIIEHLEWLEHVYDGELQNNPCAATVYNKLKNNKTAFNILKNFEGAAPVMHLEWKIEDLGACNSSACDSGYTMSSPYNALITIKLNSNMLSSASKVWVAGTMLHELLHAHIFRMVHSEEDDDPYFPNEHDFPSLYEAYRINRDYSHEYMATHYVTIFKNALQSYCQSAGITVNDAVLTAVAWSGLQGTTPWNNLPANTRLQYNTIQGQQLVAGGCP